MCKERLTLYVLATFALCAGKASLLFAASDHLPDEIVVKFRAGTSPQHVAGINSRYGATDVYTSPFAHFKRLKVPAGWLPEKLARMYSALPEVEYAELNYYARLFTAPNDQFYSYQWNFWDSYRGIDVEAAWTVTAGEPNVIAAVVDTGVAYENYSYHGKNYQLAPDLAGTRFVSGYDFAYGDAHPNDDDGHGTHVTGTIAQTTNNTIGCAGIAYNCSIMPVKVLDKRGTAPYTTIADGVYYAVNNGAKVINLSLGGTADALTLRNAVAYAYSRHVTILCAAGNEYLSGNPPSYPAAYDDYCIAVGATRYDRTRAPYSNTGSYLDIVAPGGDTGVDQNGDGYPDGILQQTFGNTPTDWGYYFYQGTSMATPHVTATAALLYSLGIEDPNCIRRAIQNTARDLGTAGWDPQYGWGLIDAAAALQYASLAGDFNKDLAVDGKDLAIIYSYWLENYPPADIAGGDGIINFLDFAALAANWGTRH